MKICHISLYDLGLLILIFIFYSVNSVMFYLIHNFIKLFLILWEAKCKCLLICRSEIWVVQSIKVWYLWRTFLLRWFKCLDMVEIIPMRNLDKMCTMNSSQCIVFLFCNSLNLWCFFSFMLSFHIFVFFGLANSVVLYVFRHIRVYLDFYSKNSVKWQSRNILLHWPSPELLSPDEKKRYEN